MAKVSYSDVEESLDSTENTEETIEVESKEEVKPNPVEEKVDALSKQYESLQASLQAINQSLQANKKPDDSQLKGMEAANQDKETIKARKQALIQAGVKPEEMASLMEMMEIQFAEKYGVNLDRFVANTNQATKNVQDVYGLASNLAYREALQELSSDADLNQNEDLLIGFKDWKQSDWDKRQFNPGELRIILSDPVNVLRTEYEKYHTKLLTNPKLKDERKKLMEQAKKNNEQRKRGANISDGQSSGLSRTLTEDDVRPKKRTVNESVVNDIATKFNFLSPPSFTGEDRD